MPARRAPLLLLSAGLLLAMRCDLSIPRAVSQPVKLASPVFVTAPAGDVRVFVVERGGAIRILDARGELLADPFLDLADRVGGGGERGLLGLAFPPEYALSGQFYVFYVAANGDSLLSRFETSADPDLALPDSETQLLRIPHPTDEHYGGTIAFSPVDGMLYWGLGDGGGINDPFDQAQDPTTLLGKMLRLDVGPDPVLGWDPARPLRTPADNPFVADPGVRDEIWALGVRNPYRFSFDAETGELWLADVGQSRREEINREPAGAGGRNYGWPVHEGALCHIPDPDRGLRCTFPQRPDPFTFPVYEYGHGLGCAVTGGVVHRGPLSLLSGGYLFSDFCTGRIWSLDPRTNDVADLTPILGSFPGATSVSADGLGQVWVTTLDGGLYLLNGRRDRDGDGIADATDVCPDVRDPAQDGTACGADDDDGPGPVPN